MVDEEGGTGQGLGRSGGTRARLGSKVDSSEAAEPVGLEQVGFLDAIERGEGERRGGSGGWIEVGVMQDRAGVMGKVN